MVEVCKQLRVTKAAYYRWCNQYGGMKADDAMRLTVLEKENSSLKRFVADQALGVDMLKEVNRETTKCDSPPGRRQLRHGYV